MPVQRLSLDDYRDIAESRGLEFFGDVYPSDVWIEAPLDVDTPPNGKSKTYWRCLGCGRIHHKSYRAVRNRPNGCRHGAADTHQPPAYHALAKKWGMEFLPGRYVAQNSKQKQNWRVLHSGEVISASYDEINVKMSNKVKKALGLPYNTRGGDFSHV